MSGPEQTAGPLVAVALKWVDCRPEVDPLTGAMVTDPRTSGASAADRSALEWALRVAEAWAGHVVAVTVGPTGADVVLREAMAAGARRAVRVDAAGDAPSGDVAAALAEVVGGASLVVCGDWSLDRGSGSVPAFLAGHLGAAQALGCTGLAVDPATPGAVRAERRLDGGRRERLRVRPPGVVSVEGGSALLRRAPLAGALRSRRAPIEVVTPTSRCLPPPPPPLRLTDRVSPALEIRPESPPPAPEGGSVSSPPAPEGGPDPASPVLAHPWGAGPAVPRRSPYRPRPRVLPPPPAGLDARQRILVLTGALVERTPPRLLVLDPPAAADRILDQLRLWGYLDRMSGPAARETDAASSSAAGAVRGLRGPALREGSEPGGRPWEVERTSGPAGSEARGSSGGAAQDADGRSGAAAPEAG